MTRKSLPRDVLAKMRNSIRYRIMRARHMDDNPLCALCLESGMVVAATELDHVVPLRIDPDRFWDTTNIQSLCRQCHENKTAEENGRSEERQQWKTHLQKWM